MIAGVASGTMISRKTWKDLKRRHGVPPLRSGA
jgi:hypothetical protein